jgi:signal transduction histidine kinase
MNRSWKKLGKDAPLARAVAAVAFVGGLLVLLGWFIDLDWLKSGLPGLVAMNPATAVLFMLAAVALWLAADSAMDRPRLLVVRSLASLVLTGAMLQLLGYAVGWGPTFDGWLFASRLAGNRMAPNTACYFALIAVALLLTDVHWRRLRYPGQAVACLAMVLALLSLLGYLFETKPLYGLSSHIPMALNTAMLFLCLALGLICLRPSEGLPTLVTGPRIGSVMARRLLPAAIATTCVIGFVRLVSERIGIINLEFGVTLMVILNAIMLSMAILVTAGALNRADEEKLRAARQLAELNIDLEERINQRVAELAEANHDLQQKSQENEMFVYSVSHDLRSPLVNLEGFSNELSLTATELRELIEEAGLPGPLNARASRMLDNDFRESIHFIQAAVKRLSSIIDALLHLSRIGRVEYHFQPVDMRGLVSGIIESMHATLTERQVEVSVGPMSTSLGDETALEQLFANLIGNAVKYLDPQRAGRIEIGEAAPEGGLRVYFVKDNGLGIPEAYQAKVFDTFKRFHPQRAPGDGMGLAIVRRIVERHKGTIRVESQEGCGSTFYVGLPQCAAVDDRALSTEPSATAV